MSIRGLKFSRFDLEIYFLLFSLCKPCNCCAGFFKTVHV